MAPIMFRDLIFCTQRRVVALFFAFVCVLFVPDFGIHAHAGLPVPDRKPNHAEKSLSISNVIHYTLNDFKKARNSNKDRYKKFGTLIVPGKKPLLSLSNSNKIKNTETVQSYKIPTDIRAYKKSIRTLIKNKKFDEAIKKLNILNKENAIEHKEYAEFTTSIAAGYLYAGHIDDAYAFARKSIDNSDQNTAHAGWIGGLAAWEKGHYIQAAKLFAIPAHSKESSSWMRSAALFWAGRSWGKAGYRKESVQYLQKSAQYSQTFYGILAQESLKNTSQDHQANTYMAVKNTDMLHMISSTSEALGNMRIYNRYRVDPALVYAIVQQESVFNPNATSKSGAKGLMQIMPKTAQYVARKINIHLGKEQETLFDPQVNLAIGQAYLSHLMADSAVNGDLISLLMAYNGGPGNLRRWKKQWSQIRDPLLFIELIPLAETRAYVERVLANYWRYHLANGKRPPSLNVMVQQEKKQYVSSRTQTWNKFLTASYNR